MNLYKSEEVINFMKIKLQSFAQFITYYCFKRYPNVNVSKKG